MEIFWGCVLEVIIFISPKFEHLWICFDSSIVKISKGCVLVNALDSVSGQHRLTDTWVQSRRINRCIQGSVARVFGVSVECTGASLFVSIGSTGVACVCAVLGRLTGVLSFLSAG